MSGTNEWVRFTRRTDDPKLAWLEARLKDLGIESRRNGESWHAPILEVHEQDLDAAWQVLTPVDEVDDEDPRWPRYDILPGEAYPWDQPTGAEEIPDWPEHCLACGQELNEDTGTRCPACGAELFEVEDE